MKTFACAVLAAAMIAGTRPAFADTTPVPDPTWHDAKVQAHKDVDELEAQIEALEARARREGEGTRARISDSMRVLRLRKREADREVAHLETAAESTRHDAEVRVERAVRRAKLAYRRAVNAFEPPPAR
jgi:hypothetical protein